MEKKEEKINKVKNTIHEAFQILSVIQWLIAVIFSSGTTIMVVIIMPTINFLVGCLLWVMIVLVVAFIAIYYNQTKEANRLRLLAIEEAKAREEREKEEKELQGW